MSPDRIKIKLRQERQDLHAFKIELEKHPPGSEQWKKYEKLIITKRKAIANFERRL